MNYLKSLFASIVCAALFTAGCGPVRTAFDVTPVDATIPDTVGLDTGNDISATCTDAEMRCGDRCADTQTDRDNCGACGQACGLAEACHAGACMLACPMPEVACHGLCVNTQTDSMNCGACGSACPPGKLCALGACQANCPTGLTECTNAVTPDAGTGDATADVSGPVTNHFCANTTVDRNNCGACGTTCPTGHVCVGGVCGTECPTGQTLCGSQCIDLMTNSLFCGSCSTACPSGQTCGGGVCSQMCPAGWTFCTDRCLNLQTDRLHCGGCTTPCPAGQLCAAGSCGVVCPTGYSLCGSTCLNTTTDAANCGGCGTACPSGQVCSAGVCSTASCLPGQRLCGTACVDPASDPANCGACGVACGGGYSCVGGYCRPLATTDAAACLPPSTQCGLRCIDLSSDNSNCGACGTVCAINQTCVGGMCVAPCAAGQQRCPPSMVCASLNTDPANCGACGMTCPTGAACQSGHCFGYQLMNSPAGVTFVDACAATGAMTYLAGADDGSALVPAPFAFQYWGATIASGAMVNISSNGFINLDGVAATNLSGTVPSTATPNSTIAVHWGDGHNGTPGQCVATVGTAPNRQWVFEWTNDYYCCTVGTTSLTYEIVLTETSNTIDFVYGTMTGARAQTMGIENATGTFGVNACPGGTGSCAPTTGQTVRFSPL